MPTRLAALGQALLQTPAAEALWGRSARNPGDARGYVRKAGSKLENVVLMVLGFYEAIMKGIALRLSEE